MKKTKIFLLFLALFAMYAFAKQPVGGPVETVAGAREEQTLEIATLPVADEATIVPPVPQNLVPAPEISASAVLIADTATGMSLYEKNPDKRLPIASLTKLMTALVAVETGDLADEVEISPTDLEVAQFRVGFKAGEKIRVKDLLAAMLVSSANDAALALSRYSAGSTENFIKEMNDLAARIGMSDTVFANPIGFDSPNHYSTASDLSKLVHEFIRHDDLMELVRMKTATVSTISGSETRRLYTTNQLLLDRPDIIGLKTGYTTEAKGSLIILVSKPSYYSIVLGSLNREEETKRLLDWVEKEFVWTPLEAGLSN